MLELILFIIGIGLLVKGANWLIDGSSSLAKRLGMSSLVIGLTILAFGTSLPELIVSLFAAVQGNGDIVLGNIIGSNISNILLILGISATIMSIRVTRTTTWKEIPFAFVAVLVLLVFSLAHRLDNVSSTIFRFEGLLLLLFFSIFVYYVIELALTTKKHEDIPVKQLPLWKCMLFIILGLAMLFLGGKWVVDGAVFLAQLLGLSKYIISATIVAVGTSLPELVTSVIAMMRKEHNLAVGNIIGSNIFNIFFILGITTLITPITISASVVLDIILLLGATLLLFVFLLYPKPHQITRWEGALFVLLYIAYVTFLLLR
ncbi:MAG: calcium/sodium antiporter [archaeon]